jgi:rRNA processing protein Gar1
MRLLGQVEVILRDKAVVRIADVSSIPMISSSVYNERREYIGRLIDVIGPVSKPYAVVSIKREGYKPSIGESLYYTYKPSRRKKSFR